MLCVLCAACDDFATFDDFGTFYIQNDICWSDPVDAETTKNEPSGWTVRLKTHN